MHSRHLICLLAFAIGACRTTTTSRTTSSPGVVVTRTAAVRAWEVWDGDHRLGTIVRYEDPTDLARAFYSVRNLDQQDLGLVDLQGRAWRYLPHQREPAWLGTGTVTQGAARILDGDASVELREISIESLALDRAHPPPQ